MVPPPADAPPGPYSTPLPSDFSTVVVSVLPTSPYPPVISSFSSGTNSSVSSMLHSTAISSLPVPPTRYFSPAPSSCVLYGGSEVVLLLPFSAVALVSIVSVIPFTAPALSRFASPPSLGLPPAPLTPPLSSLRFLRSSAPPCAPPPTAPAADIYLKDKDFSDRTGRSEARWTTVGGSVPHGKCPSRPIAMVRDGISRILLLRRPQ